MLTINVHFNPMIDAIDMDLTERRMELITGKFHYPVCSKHPRQPSELAFRAAGGRDFAAPVKFCCKPFERTALKELNNFLKANPDRP